jgi:hypothetical protein
MYAIQINAALLVGKRAAKAKVMVNSMHICYRVLTRGMHMERQLTNVAARHLCGACRCCSPTCSDRNPDVNGSSHGRAQSTHL